MTPKEKAEDLVYEFVNVNPTDVEYGIDWKMAKQCALIAVDEVLNYAKNHGFIGLTEFYEEVKNEIKKL